MKARFALPNRAKLVSALGVLGVTAGFLVGVAQPASAVNASQPTLVNAVPAAYTPNIDGGVVYSIVQVGTWIVAGGSFSSVTPHGSSTAVSVDGVVAFNQSTGALDTGFAPALNGGVDVDAVLPGPTSNTVYVGGSFSTVNGVKSKGITLLNLSDGSIVSGFTPPALNGAVQAMRLSGGRLYLTGGFTLVGTATHDGLATLNPSTGALDPFMAVQLTGHHNYNGTSGADGAVGGRAMDISPDGTRAVVIGNFKDANGVLHDQIVMLDLTGSSAAIDTSWNTSGYTAACASNSFDTYIEDVDSSPDGSYFAIAATGGGGNGARNTDGTRALCDSATRWSSTDTGTDVQPTWIDYTGNDTFWSVAVTGTAIYFGGHERWVNNPNGQDSPGTGALPRPGIAALDPSNGLPFSWNPGRNPRGAGAYALLATAQGLYVGSDTDYIGNYEYKHDEIAFFPIAGGETLPSTATATLPNNLYQAGPTNTGSTNALLSHAVSSSSYGPATGVATSVGWSAARGAFVAGNTIFYADTDGNFYRATFNGSTVGTPVAIDPYDDPTWDNVQTGSGDTYQGEKPTFYSELSSVTGAFYTNGRIYYTLSGKNALYWRYFTPESGVIGATENTISNVSFATNVAGMVLSGSTLYYANKNDGTLHTIGFSSGTVTGSDTTVSGPKIDGNDWRSRGLFIYSASGPANTPPVAQATASCSGLTCAFNGSASYDPDGSVKSYAWTFGDGGTATGATTSHTYASAATYTVSLTVTDNGGATNTWTGQVTPTASTGPAVANVGENDYNGSSADPSVTVPSGVSAGDTELLLVSVNTAGVTGTPTGLTGWTQLTKVTNSTLETTVFQRTATAGDSGTAVAVPLTKAEKVDLQLVGYSGVAAGAVSLASSVDNTTATHTAPPISVPTAGSWVMSYWSDRSTGTTSWTLPASVTSRGIWTGTGSAAVSGVIADSGQPVTTGTYPSQTATANSTSGRGNMLTIVLTPAN